MGPLLCDVVHCDTPFVKKWIYVNRGHGPLESQETKKVPAAMQLTLMKSETIWIVTGYMQYTIDEFFRQTTNRSHNI